MTAWTIRIDRIQADDIVRVRQLLIDALAQAGVAHEGTITEKSWMLEQKEAFAREKPVGDAEKAQKRRGGNTWVIPDC